MSPWEDTPYDPENPVVTVRCIPSVEDRYWSQIEPEPTSGCWLWTGAMSSGYGTLSISNKATYVHRWSYEHHIGPIPKGLELDHLCRTPACSNPVHLEPVTHRENMMRGKGVASMHAAKTHCVHGHPFTPENMLRVSSRPNARICKTCKNRRDRRYHARKRAMR